MFGMFRVIEGPDKGRTFTVVDQQTITIGHGGDSFTQLKDGKVAPIHCRAECRDGAVILTAANPQMETFVNGNPITEQKLEKGDEIQLGSTRMVFEPTAMDEHSTLEAFALPANLDFLKKEPDKESDRG